MPLLNKLRQYFSPTRLPESEPAAAYDIWALQYDNQPDNLMLALDEQVFADLLAQTPAPAAPDDKGGASPTGEVIADIGCGTGRHWPKLYERRPSRLIGFDVSQGMLDILLQKHPQADTRLLTDARLALPSASCDMVISTLTVAHIPDIEAAFTEWKRVLKPGGRLIITDYHPEALARGGQRTFRDDHRVIAIRNHVYPLYEIKEITRRLGLETQQVIERSIDGSMRPYYEKQNATALFERFLGVPIIYGLQLKRSDVAH